jgi:Ca-activated chloride channel family protein
LILDYFKDIIFANPWFFSAGILLPAMLYWYIARHNKQHAAVMISDISAKDVSSLKTAMRHLPFILRLGALAFIITAMANPQTKNTEQLAEGEGIDIIVCTDVSGSMSAKDLQPNRLEAAKKVMTGFMLQRLTDRIGIVLFAGESYTLCPLTTDKAVLQNAISNIRIGLLTDGTAIGDGLGTSVERLKESNAKSKIVVLLTDGENNGGKIDPGFAKEIAKVFGVKVYTIGVGQDGDVDVPQNTELGIVTERKRFSLNEPLLKEIAAETGGSYFRATDNKSLEEIYSQIDKLEKSDVQISTSAKYTAKFLVFVLAAAILLFLEIVLRLTVFKRFP